MTEDLVVSDIEKTNQRLKELIKSCPRYLQRHYDDCQDCCLIVSICWDFQDEDADFAEDLQKTLNGEEVG